MVFGDGNKLTLSPENYLFQVSILFCFSTLLTILPDTILESDLLASFSFYYFVLIIFPLFHCTLYVLKHFKVRGAYCLGIFPNEKNPTSLLGGTSHYLTRQNSSPPPPSPSTPVVSCLDNRNSTAHMSPSPAPSGPPGYNIPDQITAANVAEECLLASLKADSKAAHIWTSVANAYYLMSDHRSSAKCLEKVGKIEPNCLAVRYAVGVHRIRDAESQ
ncbi:uncharacterized protein LOC107852710 isoform X1 [Capsicum annuum]|uniref:uncharacterized protein LOC107852710 isoform X1 n=1 Tax=Capsicum annuum TaxID=4072 RepID=UPI0007BFA6D0|nr:uncharacterized protein LOC107852710 isoform X1 [Capsicum annuum]XP_047262387.1 uncharacterized protein LOC107852710 isoform X1 [Capsicum annuum]XP_047262388.1 uncharacterized protein LOC107852710 isoform X1 [Capsicum annuum]XP_047262389.1 uncharacterized protein LOC107852710 isoform X1 [Capsicum annuum]XP_047262390.1 uncharacterized protein LOC107852710 isoform X1 [Capsicum annuum]XP_047262391.1 uncharacterized protein LOC107852710 isoform X1 [Capsicum annuum]XP_047262392.1 uncharacterize